MPNTPSEFELGLDLDDTLYDYQRGGIKKVHNASRICVWAPPGSGKTRIACEGILNTGGNCLILCPRSAVPTWEVQLKQWLGAAVRQITVVLGSRDKRRRLWPEQPTHSLDCYITTYESFRRDYLDGLVDITIGDALTRQRSIWNILICDEYHKVMLRHKHGKNVASTHWRVIQRFVTQPAIRDDVYPLHRYPRPELSKCVWITGSFLRREPSSLWTAFNMVDHKRWSSYHRWVSRYCVVNQGRFGIELLGPKNTKELRGLLDEHCVFITERMVAAQLPQGVRYKTVIQMSRTQQRLYDTLKRDMVLYTEDGDFIATPTVLSQIVRLRQILCSPKLLEPASNDWGAGIDYILENLINHPDDGNHMVIFVPFRDGCYVVSEALEGASVPHEILHGSLAISELRKRIHRFKRTECALVCTIAFAESFDLETCKRSVFLGYDYALDVNQQAEGRTRRAISPHNTVYWEYLVYKDTVDEHFIDKLNMDTRNTSRVLYEPQVPHIVETQH